MVVRGLVDVVRKSSSQIERTYIYLYLKATAMDATCRLSVSHRAVIVDLMTADGEMNA